MKNKIFSGATLEEALKGDALEQAEIELTGMVKPSEKPGHIAFARGDCETWVDMPSDMIDQAEWIGQKRCKDHSHPHFKITLKKPTSPETSLFAQLLAMSPTNSSGPGSSLQTRTSGSIPVGYQAGSFHSKYYPVASGSRNNFAPAHSGYGSSGSVPGYASPRISPRLGIGGGGTPIGGGYGDYNYCWDSECCDCVPNGEPCWTDGAGVDHCPCDNVCNPCVRCLFPW